MPKLTNYLRSLVGLKASAPAPAAPVSGESSGYVPLTAAVGFADLEATAADPKKRPTFQIKAYTGVAMNVADWYSPVVLDLAGLKAARAKLPILLDHDSSQIVGQGTPKIDASGLEISGVVTGDDACANKVVANAKNGFEWQASVGAQVTRREFLEAGKTATVNGREVSGPCIIAREAIVREVSFVAIGADGNTSASVAATSQGGSVMTFEQWLQAQGIDPTKVSADVKASLKTNYDAAVKAAGGTLPAAPAPTAPPVQAAAPTQTSTLPVALPAPTVDVAAEVVKAQNANALRLADIDRVCAGGHVELRAQAIKENWPADRVELEVLRASRSSGPAIHVVNKDATPEVIHAAICQAGNLNAHEKLFKPEVLQAAHTQYRGRIGLQQIYLDAAWANGYTGRHFDKSAAGMEAILRAAFSTHSLSGVLSNTANKFLLEGYMHVDDSCLKIAAVRSVSDFKTSTSYRMTGAFQFEKVGPDGRLNHETGVNEQSFTNKAETYGKMFSITRHDLINDDLGALTSLPKRIGRGAALKRNDVFWTEFMDNASFFATGNNNYFSGASTNLSSSSLTTAVSKFRKQVDADSKPLAVTPKLLLVAPEDESTADELYVSRNLQSGNTGKQPDQNVHAGKYQPVVSPYLSNSAYTGYSTTAWHLLADPLDVAVIELVFLNGVQNPTVETSDADFGTLGTDMRGFFDFGCSKQDYRGGVKSKGAA